MADRLLASGTNVVRDIGSSIDAVQDVIDTFSEHRPELAPDLPGHGETDNLDAAKNGYLNTCIEVLRALVDEVDLQGINILAIGESAPVAASFCSENAERVKQLVLLDPLSNSEIVAMQPNIDGSHLTSLWHIFRNIELYYPHDQWSAESALQGEPALDPILINRKVVDYLRCRAVYAAARLACNSYPIAESIAACEVNVRVARTTGTTCGDRSVRNFTVKSDSIELPRQMGRWPHVLLYQE